MSTYIADLNETNGIDDMIQEQLTDENIPESMMQEFENGRGDE